MNIQISWKKSIVRMCVLLAVFLIIAFTYETAFVKEIDQAVGDTLRAMQSKVLTFIFIMITMFGDTTMYILLMVTIGGYFIIRLRRFRETLFLLLSLVGAWQLNEALKRLFERSRPTVEHLIEQGGHAFPSGHAMISVAFYGFVIFLFYYLFWQDARKLRVVRAFAIWFFLVMGMSRIYLGVHFTSDVLAGYIMGSIWLILSITAYLAFVQRKAPADSTDTPTTES